MCDNAPKEILEGRRLSFMPAPAMGGTAIHISGESEENLVLGNIREGLAPALENGSEVRVTGEFAAGCGNRICIKNVRYEYKVEGSSHSGTLSHLNVFDADEFRTAGFGKNDFVSFTADPYLYQRNSGEYDISLKNCRNIKILSVEEFERSQKEKIPRVRSSSVFVQERAAKARQNIFISEPPENSLWFRIVEFSAEYSADEKHKIFPGCTAANIMKSKTRVVSSFRLRNQAEKEFSKLKSLVKKTENGYRVSEYALYECGEDEVGEFAEELCESPFTVKTLADAFEWEKFSFAGEEYAVCPSGDKSGKIAKAETKINADGTFGYVAEMSGNSFLSQMFPFGAAERYKAADLENSDSEYYKTSEEADAVKTVSENEANEVPILEISSDESGFAVMEYSCETNISDADEIDKCFAIKNSEKAAVVWTFPSIEEANTYFKRMHSSVAKENGNIIVTEYVLAEKNDAGQYEILEKSQFQLRQIVEEAGLKIIKANGGLSFAVIEEKQKNKKSTEYKLISLEDKTFSKIITSRFKFCSKEKDTDTFKAVVQIDNNAPPVNAFSLLREQKG